jgi:hypothetical protein
VWRSQHARKRPRSGRRRPRPARRRPRPETPRRRPSYAARNCRLSLSLVSNVCKLLTTAPVEPSCSVGIGPPSGRAVHVTGPTIPSTVSPAPCWNCFTAVSSCGPKTPSTVSPRSGVRRSARSNRFTASPVAPRLLWVVPDWPCVPSEKDFRWDEFNLPSLGQSGKP